MEIAFLQKDPRQHEELDHFRRESRISRSPLQGRRLGRERRCGAKVVPLTLGDALINSRRWLTSQLQNLYSNEDHFLPVAPLWFCPTEETNLRASTLYASYYSSYFLWIINHQASFWPRAIETKSGQNLVFDPGGSTGLLRACPFSGTWRALLCRGDLLRALEEAAAFFGGRTTRELYCGRVTGESFTPHV